MTLDLETVTTTDRSLLRQVRQTLSSADSALLCVAFVHARGIHLVENELAGLRKRGAPVRLLVTTTFSTTDESALALAYSHGVKVRVLNPSGSTFHPKVYFGSQAKTAQAVVGSANLTGGLATNVEAGIWMRGASNEPALARIQQFTEELWEDPRATDWEPSRAAEADDDVLAPDLLAALVALRREDPLVLTLGPRPKQNRVVEVTPAEVLVETDRSKSRAGGAASVPAWMINLAWDYLRAHGELSNRTLLRELRVHRSSAVCAMLARLPGVATVPGREIRLRWAGVERVVRARP